MRTAAVSLSVTLNLVGGAAENFCNRTRAQSLIDLAGRILLPVKWANHSSISTTHREPGRHANNYYLHVLYSRKLTVFLCDIDTEYTKDRNALSSGI